MSPLADPLKGYNGLLRASMKINQSIRGADNISRILFDPEAFFVITFNNLGSFPPIRIPLGVL